MNRSLDCIQIWYGCSLDISDDMINFSDESVKKKMAAAAIKKNWHGGTGGHFKWIPVIFLQTWSMCLGNSSHIFLAPSNKRPFSKMAVWKACGYDNLWTVGWIAFKFGLVVF